ncbi:MAG TPA: T9SS type A sorting domain-containing protein [Bacteroidia bacterium]|nr:T9SS type A sorting domain-containing protein [Bacteroidia bacterium]
MEIKRLIRSIAVLLILNSACLISYAQPANWLWAGSAAGTGLSAACRANCTDINGNVLVTGVFYNPSISFGGIVLSNNSITNNSDIFVVKYDDAGNVLWAKSEGGIYGEGSLGISTDAYGNVYVTGSFSSPTITFGSTVLTNSGAGDFFLVKYDSSGNVLWAKQASGTDGEGGYAVCTDANGNVMVTGSYNSPTLTFGSIVLTNAGVTGTGDIFITKYDSSGNVLWAKRAGGTYHELAWGISTDANGNIFVTGSFTSPTLDFGGIILTNTGVGLTSLDVFIAKYDSSGNVLWGKNPIGIDSDSGMGIATDSDGNALITGFFESPSLTLGSIVLINSGGNCSTNACPDVFIAKYDASGNILWAKRAGGNGEDQGFSICTDNAGNAYITGLLFSPTITFGSITLTPNCPWPQCYPMFIAKYDSAGNALCAVSLDSFGYGKGGVTADNFGNAYISDEFNIDPFIVGNYTLTLNGTSNVFTAKFTCGATASNELIGGNDQVQIFPNPFMNQLKIHSRFVKQKSELKVYDVFGRTIYSQKSLPENNTLNTAGWQKGIYFLDVSINGERTVKKILKG